MNNKMFCFQCQETAGNKGCTLQGVCGKKPEVAQLQDLLVWTTKGLCAVTSRLRDEGKTIDKETNHLITQNLFITITNANFDASAIIKAIEKLSPQKKRFYLNSRISPSYPTQLIGLVIKTPSQPRRRLSEFFLR